MVDIAEAALAKRWSPEPFLPRDLDGIRTPALVIVPSRVDSNIDEAIRLVGGDVERWRPHLKTSKLDWTVKRLLAKGVTRVKCATVHELERALALGVADAVLAHLVRGPSVRDVKRLTTLYPGRVSVLVESAGDVEQWAGSDVGVFVDVDTGAGRTGAQPRAVAGLIAEVDRAGLRLRGLHGYESHPPGPARARARWTRAAVERLLAVVPAAGVDEVITSGSVSFVAAAGVVTPSRVAVHRLSPGTVVYHDARTERELVARHALLPAAAVITRVVSHPANDRVVCDAGSKSLSADVDGAVGVVAGQPGWRVQRPSEEHLPVRLDGPPPDRGTPLVIVPTHVCPTVNLYDRALLVEGGDLLDTVPVTARGRLTPISAPDATALRFDVLAVRDFGVDLHAQLAALLQTVFGTTDYHDFRRRHPGHAVVALRGDELVAHVGLAPRRAVAGDHPIDVVAVGGVLSAPAARGTGIGATTMQVAATWIRQDAVAEFGLLRCLPAVRPFYEKLGWRAAPGPMLHTGPAALSDPPGQSAMVLPVSDHAWPQAGPIDLGGPPF